MKYNIMCTFTFTLTSVVIVIALLSLSFYQTMKLDLTLSVQYSSLYSEELYLYSSCSNFSSEITSLLIGLSLSVINNILSGCASFALTVVIFAAVTCVACTGVGRVEIHPELAHSTKVLGFLRHRPTTCVGFGS